MTEKDFTAESPDHVMGCQLCRHWPSPTFSHKPSQCARHPSYDQFFTETGMSDLWKNGPFWVNVRILLKCVLTFLQSFNCSKSLDALVCARRGSLHHLLNKLHPRSINSDLFCSRFYYYNRDGCWYCEIVSSGFKNQTSLIPKLQSRSGFCTIFITGYH